MRAKATTQQTPEIYTLLPNGVLEVSRLSINSLLSILGANSLTGSILRNCNPDLASAVPGTLGRGGSYWTDSPNTDTINGVSFQRSKIGFRHISDGSSNTYMVGEKYLNPENYDAPFSWGDDRGWTTGVSDDMHRSASFPPLPDTIGLPGHSVPGNSNDQAFYFYRFGSAHSGGFHMAFCDGHTESISYDVDITVHQLRANRHDEQIAN